MKLFGRDTATIDGTGAAISLGLLAAAAVFGIVPVREIELQQSAREAELERIQADTRAALSDLQNLERLTRQAETDADDLRLTLRPRTDLNARLAELIARAESFGLGVRSVTPGEPVEGELHSRTPVDLTVEGGLPEFVRFLHGLRIEDADLIVMGLSIRPAAVADGVTADIRADWLTGAG